MCMHCGTATFTRIVARCSDSSGQRLLATLFAMLDDRSRLCCHAQWYLDHERTEVFVHGDDPSVAEAWPTASDHE